MLVVVQVWCTGEVRSLLYRCGAQWRAGEAGSSRAFSALSAEISAVSPHSRLALRHYHLRFSPFINCWCLDMWGGFTRFCDISLWVVVERRASDAIGGLFCSLAVFDPRVGHTMDVLSPFISVLCHSDGLFHGESCPRLDIVHPGRAWPSSPVCT